MRMELPASIDIQPLGLGYPACDRSSSQISPSATSTGSVAIIAGKRFAAIAGGDEGDPIGTVNIDVFGTRWAMHFGAAAIGDGLHLREHTGVSRDAISLKRNQTRRGS